MVPLRTAQRLLLILALPLSMGLFWSFSRSQSGPLVPAYAQDSIPKTAIADKAAVACAHPLAAQVGIDILKQGGNAIDAAIAVQMALAVVYPRAGNLGGGGFLVYRSGDGKEVSTLDFREKAPASAYRDMYLDAKGTVIPDLSQKGALAAGVPGTVDGCWQMFQKYSKLKDWKKLVQPAVLLAEQGFAITALEANRLNENRSLFLKYNSKPTVLVKSGADTLWQQGDILIQKDLANTLTLIREKGREGFYEGVVADKIVAEMQRSKGKMTHQDLKNYRATWRKPLLGDYRGYGIIAMPPPSSGGIALLQLLGTVERYPLSTYGFHTEKSMHLIVEAEKWVYADRSEHLGDADFYPVPVKKLRDRAYIQKRFGFFKSDMATPSAAVKPGTIAYKRPKNSEQTTHLSIVDAEGNAVSLTTTLNDNYGCRTVVGEAGFLLNNEMDDFSVKPGVPNLYGAIGGEANAISANKRPLSSMTPTIVTKDGRLFMVVGTPGGTTIITSVFQVITNVIDFNMSATQATHAPRFHSQWLPDVVFFEDNKFDVGLLERLTKMGHKMQKRAYIGAVETILVRSDGRLEAAADNRGDDAALGY